MALSKPLSHTSVLFSLNNLFMRKINYLYLDASQVHSSFWIFFAKVGAAYLTPYSNFNLDVSQLPHSQYIHNWAHNLWATNTSTHSLSLSACRIYLSHPRLPSRSTVHILHKSLWHHLVPGTVISSYTAAGHLSIVIYPFST